jgi:hypothetical protein
VLGAREDNIEHVIYHLTKALEYVSIEGPGTATERFDKGPLDGYVVIWSELMTLLGSSYGKRLKVSSFMVKSVCALLDGVLPLNV